MDFNFKFTCCANPANSLYLKLGGAGGIGIIHRRGDLAYSVWLTTEKTVQLAEELTKLLQSDTYGVTSTYSCKIMSNRDSLLVAMPPSGYIDVQHVCVDGRVFPVCLTKPMATNLVEALTRVARMQMGE